MPYEGGVPIDRRREPLPTRVEDTAALPDTFREALEHGLAELSLEPSENALAIFEGHARLLLAWTRAINLTAIRDPREVAVRHVLDSLSAVPWLLERGVRSLLDLGSGGGFPGIPLAAALPTLHVTLLEPVTKKARFLATAVEVTGLGRRADVRAERAEELARDRRHRGRWDAVTARAVGETADLVEVAFPLLRPGGALLAWKRGAVDAELARADRAIESLGGGSLTVVDVPLDGLSGHVLVAVTRAADSVVPDGFPRDPAARRRRPW